MTTPETVTAHDVIARRMASRIIHEYPKGKADIIATDALDALAAAGYAVVRLPEPEVDDTAIFALGVGTNYVEAGSRGIDATLAGTRDLITVEHARALAAALLAAANHQEKNR